jgi:hypothetical protein
LLAIFVSYLSRVVEVYPKARKSGFFYALLFLHIRCCLGFSFFFFFLSCFSCLVFIFLIFSLIFSSNSSENFLKIRSLKSVVRIFKSASFLKISYFLFSYFHQQTSKLNKSLQLIAKQKEDSLVILRLPPRLLSLFCFVLLCFYSLPLVLF